MKRLAVVMLSFFCLLLSACGESEMQEPTAIFVMEHEEAELMPPSFMLFEDGTFSFFFSPLSSYYGHGTYRETEKVLRLNTDDGDFHYTFRKTNEGLIFDGENSSDMVWFSDITDGSVFKGGSDLDR